MPRSARRASKPISVLAVEITTVRREFDLRIDEAQGVRPDAGGVADGAARDAGLAVKKRVQARIAEHEIGRRPVEREIDGAGERSDLAFGGQVDRAAEIAPRETGERR